MLIIFILLNIVLYSNNLVKIQIQKYNFMSEIFDLLEYLFLQSGNKIFIVYWIGNHRYRNKIIAKS